MNDNVKDEFISIEVDGITFLSTGKYYDGINNIISHDLKHAEKDAIHYAARKMAALVPPDSIIVPIPNHHGTAKETLFLAKAVAEYSHSSIANILIGKARESNYLMKKLGSPLTEEQMGFQQTKPLPDGITPIIVDGVVDTGTSAKAAVHALGGGIVLSFAMSNTLLELQDVQSVGFHR
jgi:predicted amidophosphoribosyltransferase